MHQQTILIALAVVVGLVIINVMIFFLRSAHTNAVTAANAVIDTYSAVVANTLKPQLSQQLGPATVEPAGSSDPAKWPNIVLPRPTPWQTRQIEWQNIQFAKKISELVGQRVEALYHA